MKNLLLLVSILTIGAILVLLWDSPPEIFFSRKKTSVQDLPPADSYMRNTVTQKYNVNGYEAYTLNSSSGLYYRQADRFELEKPHLVSRSPTGHSTPWQLDAKNARSTKGGQQITLRGDVHAWQSTTEGNNDIRTSQLTFFPDNNTARTKAKVTLSYPGGNTTGIGLKADFTTEIYQLLSQVKGTHYAR